MRILIIEDDDKIASFVQGGLEQAGHVALRVAGGGAEAERFDLFIVDVMLPGGTDGLALIEQLRRRGVRGPVLILSAKRSVDDRVRGLQRGGDDYLTKPFAFAELLARIGALARPARAGRPSRPGWAWPTWR
jgi:two-component system OmpR family response regulator